MIFYELKLNSGSIIAGNMNQFSGRHNPSKFANYNIHSNGKGIRSKLKQFDGFTVWVVVENEADLLNSTKQFEKLVSIYSRVGQDVWTFQSRQTEKFSHTLDTIQAQMAQKIEGFASDEVFQTQHYSEALFKVKSQVAKDIDGASELIINLRKRIDDLNAHLLGMSVIHFGKELVLQKRQVNLRNSLLRFYSPFLDDFDDIGVTVQFQIAESHEISVDKNLFSLVMFNFIDNAVKYVCPKTKIVFYDSVYPSELHVKMFSLRIEKNEHATLFNDSFRGKNAQNYPGSGIGLHVLKKALELMNIEIEVSSNYEKGKTIDGVPFTENTFKFYLPS